MNYDDHQRETKRWHADLVKLNEGRDDRDWLLPLQDDHWPHVIADVECETPGCPHGVQRVMLIDFGTGEYHSHCGNCNTTNTKITGHFADGPRVLKAHMPPVVEENVHDYKTHLSTANRAFFTGQGHEK